MSASAVTPAVRVDSLLDQLYPNQSELFRSMNTTTSTLEMPLKTSPSRNNSDGKSTGSLIVYGRKPVLPPISPEGNDKTAAASSQMTAAEMETSVTLNRLKHSFLSTDLLRQLKQAGMFPPAVPLSLPSGLDLSSRLSPTPPAEGPVKSPTTSPIAAVTPRVPVPEKPDQAISPLALSVAKGEAIEINQASAEELMRKLQLDARRARLIIQFRTLYGPFKTPEDLAQVSGINDELVRKWENAGLLIF